jgi:hypothetical protein
VETSANIKWERQMVSKGERAKVGGSSSESEAERVRQWKQGRESLFIHRVGETDGEQGCESKAGRARQGEQASACTTTREREEAAVGRARKSERGWSATQGEQGRENKGGRVRQ